MEDWGAAIDAMVGATAGQTSENATLMAFSAPGAAVAPADPPAAMAPDPSEPTGEPEPPAAVMPEGSPPEMGAVEEPVLPVLPGQPEEGAVPEPPAEPPAGETQLLFRAPPAPAPPPREPPPPPVADPSPRLAPDPLPPAAMAPSGPPSGDRTLLEFRPPSRYDPVTRPAPAPEAEPTPDATPGPMRAEPPSWHGEPWAPEAGAVDERQSGQAGETAAAHAAVEADETPRTPPAPALEMLSADEAPPGGAATEAEAREEDLDRLLAGARDLVSLGDYSGALELVRRVRAGRPEDEEARRLEAECEKTLLQMWESKLGPIDRYPRVLLEPDEIVWLNLDHRAGFILAQIDGSVTYEDIFALSGMSRLDTCRILVQLLEQRVIISE